MPASLAPVAALLLAVLSLQVGNALINTLVPVRGQLEGWSTGLIGLLGTAYFLGFALGCFLCPLAVRRAGHIRAFAAGAAVAASCLLALPLLPHPIVWAVLRALMGLCFAGLFMVIESWLNERATSANRGQLFGTYQVLVYVGATLGQNLLGVREVTGPDLFSISAIMLTLALVPVAMTASTAPKPIRRVRVDLRWLAQSSPLAFAGCLMVGAVNGAIWSLAPVYAQSQGLSPDQVGWFMAALITGGAVSQWPVGKMSDRVDRRWMIVAAALISSVGGILLMTSYGGTLPMLLVLAAFYGAFSLTIYSLCVAHVNDIADPERFVEVASGTLLMYGIGATVGPLVASGLMEARGVPLLFAYTAALHLGLALFCAWRLMTLQRPVPEDRPAFVVTVPRTSPMPPNLDPRTKQAAGTAGGETGSDVAAPLVPAREGRGAFG
ncbi:MAG TPA: MFS transporter [Geminicoccaceae bacterium]